MSEMVKTSYVRFAIAFIGAGQECEGVESLGKGRVVRRW